MQNVGVGYNENSNSSLSLSLTRRVVSIRSSLTYKKEDVESNLNTGRKFGTISKGTFKK